MENRQKKVLILYASIGLGHKSIAENIGFYLSEGGYNVRLYDVQELQGGVLARWGKRIYQWLITAAPFVWDFFYNTCWFITATLPFRTKVAAKNYKKVFGEIESFKPDAVICTHTTASAIIDYLKSRSLYSG